MQFSYPVQDPESATAMGLIPVELDIDSLYEVHCHGKRKSTSEKPVASHVHSVCTNQLIPPYNKAEEPLSVGALRIEPRRRPSVKGKRRT
jgi:hypothetical protein